MCSSYEAADAVLPAKGGHDRCKDCTLILLLLFICDQATVPRFTEAQKLRGEPKQPFRLLLAKQVEER